MRAIPAVRRTSLVSRRHAPAAEGVPVNRVPVRRVLAAVLVVLGLLAPLAPAGAAGTGPRTVPRPTVLGPIHGGTQGHPFAAMPHEPRMGGYVESEYFVKGSAVAYDASPVALASARPAPPPPGKAPYETRMLVRRPADPARFNGTVVVEWLNVTSGYDVDAAWADMRREIVR